MSDFFKLPEGNVQIAFSGGRSSAYMLHRILEANGELPDRVVVTFQNTGREFDETLDFVQRVSESWSVPVVWLEYAPDRKGGFACVGHNSAARNGEPFRRLIEKKRYLPNAVTRFCTSELKVRVAKKYLMSLGWERWVNCVGFRADESHRTNKPPPKERWAVWHPMADAGITKREVSEFWLKQPFDLRLQNVNGKTPEGNCDGCFLKSEAIQAALARDHPERHAWWEDMEALVSQTAKKSAARFVTEFTKRELREIAENQGDWVFSQEGFFCQKSHGECAA